ncbi:MAG: hypothetical protein ACP5N1_02690 [Candidatus Woesearchaeota archaeon]
MKQKINNLHLIALGAAMSVTILPYGKPDTGKYIPEKKESFEPTDIQKRIEDMATNGIGYHNSSDYADSYFSRFNRLCSTESIFSDSIANKVDEISVIKAIEGMMGCSANYRLPSEKDVLDYISRLTTKSIDFSKVIEDAKNKPSVTIIFFKKEEKDAYTKNIENRKEENPYKPK